MTIKWQYRGEDYGGTTKEVEAEAGTLVFFAEEPLKHFILVGKDTDNSSNLLVKFGNDGNVASVTSYHYCPVAAVVLAHVPLQEATRTRGVKRKNGVVASLVVVSPCGNDGRLKVNCKKCGDQIQCALSNNAAKNRVHLESCMALTAEERKNVVESSQRWKKIKQTQQVRQTTTASGLAPHQAAASQSLASLVTLGGGLASSTSIQTLDQFVIRTTPEIFDKVFILHVECVVARFEPIERLVDVWFKRAFEANNAGLSHFIPNDASTVFDKYVLPLYRQQEQDFIARLKHLPGCAAMSVDGATVNGRSELFYCVLKGNVSRFQDLSPLGHEAHATNAEVEDGYQKMKRYLELFGKINILYVDNAALHIMNLIIARLKAEDPTWIIMIIRDPAHSIDLGPKELAKPQYVLGKLLKSVREILTLVSGDNVWCAFSFFGRYYFFFLTDLWY